MNEANSRSSNAPSGEQGKSFSSANFNDTSSISSGSSAHSDRGQSKKLSSGSSAGGHGTKNSSSNNPKRKLISALLSTTSSSNNNSNSSLCDQSFSYSSSSRTDTLSSMQRKKLRDPMAHRRVEKTRRDRMNMALIKLGSLIPNSFLKKGLTRVDKIRTVDLAIQYIQHLQSQMSTKDSQNFNQPKHHSSHHHHHHHHQGRYDDEKNQGTVPGTSSSDTSESHPFSMLKSINENVSKSDMSDSLIYLKGIFDGSVYFVAHLITFVQTKVQNLEDLKLNINLYVESLTSFNEAYFNSQKMSANEYENISKFTYGQLPMSSDDNRDNNMDTRQSPCNLQLVKEIVDLLNETRRQKSNKSSPREINDQNTGGNNKNQQNDSNLEDSMLNRMSSIASNLSCISNHNGSNSSYSSNNSSPPIPSSVCNNVNSNSNNNSSNNNDSSPNENNRINDDGDCESSYSSNSNSSEAPSQFKDMSASTSNQKADLLSKYPDLILRKQKQPQHQSTNETGNAGFSQSISNRMNTDLEDPERAFKIDRPDLLSLLAKTTALEQHRFYEQRQYNLNTASADFSDTLPDYHPLRHKQQKQRFNSPQQQQQQQQQKQQHAQSSFSSGSKQAPQQTSSDLSTSLFQPPQIDSSKLSKGYPKSPAEASYLEEQLEQLKQYKLAEMLSQHELNNRLGSARAHQSLIINANEAAAAASAAYNYREELENQRSIEYRFFTPVTKSASFQELSNPEPNHSKGLIVARMEGSNSPIEKSPPTMSRNMLSIFILHSSSEFYVSACLDESLVDQRVLNEVLKNLEFKPKSVHKIKLDVVFSPELVINNTNTRKTQFAITRTQTQP